MGPESILRGTSTAPDGTAHSVRHSPRVGDLDRDVLARSDEIRVQDAEGGDLDLGS